MAEWKRREKRDQQRLSEQKSHGIEAIVQRDFPDKKYTFKRQETNKLSDVLIKFAGPMLEVCNTFEQEKQAVGLLIIVWNADNIPELSTNRLKSMIDDFMGDNDAETKQAIVEIVQNYLNRKNAVFADDKRIVESYNLTDTREGLHLEVAYRDA